jgi:hypothetical protein
MNALSNPFTRALPFARKVLTLSLLVFAPSLVVADLVNISTRAYVEQNLRSAVPGFIIRNADPTNPNGEQCVVIRGRGPSVPVSGTLSDPYLTLFNSAGELLDENDNWQDHKYSVVLETLKLAPGDAADAAFYICLAPGSYTAQLRTGTGNSGIGIAEVILADYYDVNQILTVELKTDRDTVLAGDILDFAALPSLSPNSSYSSGNRKLTVSIEASGSVASWPQLFEPGNHYYVKLAPVGLDANITVKSGSETLGILSGDQAIEITAKMPAQDLTLVSSGPNAAEIVLSARDAIQFSWAVTNAETCSTLGEWVGFDITPGADGSANGSEVFPFFSNFQQAYSFGLRCDNLAETPVTAEVIVESTSCPGTGPVQLMQWSDLVFSAGDGFEFPNPNGNSAVVSVPQGKTLAIEFNTVTAALDDFYGNISNPEFAGVPGARDISISSCPGQFEDLPTRCVQSGFISSGAVYWEVDLLAGNLGHTCKLERGADGKKYYFNIRFPSGCGSSSCRTRVQP